MTFHGTPPAPDCGAISPRTEALRPDIGLSEEVVGAIRRLRKQGQPAADIAATLALPIEVVERAMLAMRTDRPDSTRATLNVTREAARFVNGERGRPDEPIWAVMDRLVAELIERRRAGV
ncbi:hypothetical protein M0638_12685 [Roseomonas sp. NAR14]|uniref:Uncharacterized protein n=1 Tax=Roseomonas acroporae TaxID=2937791 RepID=A0A9X1Y8U7_9PROT|nr:hypothetical protein [Roseomonas acroporae]MCK8785242.1 hypothetical protein [Roseomonas acroporae]